MYVSMYTTHTDVAYVDIDHVDINPGDIACCQGSSFTEMASLCPKDSRGCSLMPLVLCGKDGSVPGFPGSVASFIVKLNYLQHMAQWQPTNDSTHSWSILK